MSDLTLLECEDSCCGHWPSDEGGLYDALEVDDYVASLQARIAELEMGNAKLDDNLARIKDADKSYSDLEAEICKLIDALQKEAHRADELEGVNKKIIALKDRLDNGIQYNEDLNVYTVRWTEGELKQAQKKAAKIYKKLNWDKPPEE